MSVLSSWSEDSLSRRRWSIASVLIGSGLAAEISSQLLLIKKANAMLAAPMMMYNTKMAWYASTIVQPGRL